MSASIADDGYFISRQNDRFFTDGFTLLCSFFVIAGRTFYGKAGVRGRIFFEKLHSAFAAFGNMYGVQAFPMLKIDFFLGKKQGNDLFISGI